VRSSTRGGLFHVGHSSSSTARAMHPDWTLSPCTTSETRKLETCQDTVQAYLLSPSLLLCICHLFPTLHHPLHTSIDLPGRRQLHVAAQPTSPPNALVSKHLPLALANLDSFNSLAVLCGLAPRQRQPSPSSPTTTQHSSTTLHHSLCCIPHTSNSHLSTDCTAQSAHDCTASAYI
jgi:hypothetical protein